MKRLKISKFVYKPLINLSGKANGIVLFYLVMAVSAHVDDLMSLLDEES